MGSAEQDRLAAVHASFLVQVVQHLAHTSNSYEQVVPFAEEEGFRYGAVPEHYRAGALKNVGPMPRDFNPEKMECELIEVMGEIPPHFHTKSMAVLLIAKWYGYNVHAFHGSIGERKGMWRKMLPRQIHLVPPKMPHGFRGKCLLVGVNYPPIEDNDVTYL